MANRGRLQTRHGTGTQFEQNKSTILPDELVIVDSGDTETNGSAVYYKPNGGTPKRLANAEELDGISGDVSDLETALNNKVDKTTTIAGLQLNANISADALKEALSVKGITIINETTVPESATWGGTIPDTYEGETGESPELAYYEDFPAYWVLTYVDDGTYYWDKIVLHSYLDEKADLAPIAPASPINLNSGQPFVDGNNKICIKTAASGTYGDVRAYNTQYIDTMIGNIESLLAQV